MNDVQNTLIFYAYSLSKSSEAAHRRSELG
jgi:hypothetical protein